MLVTGATGFVGSRLVPALVEAGHDVKAMTRNPDDYAGLGTPVPGDVSDPGSLGGGGVGRRRGDLPRALAGRRRLREQGRRGRPILRPGRRGERGEADRLPRRARQGRRGAVRAPPLAARGREAARRERRARHRPARGDRGRRRRHLLGDDPPARQEPPGDGGAQVGSDPDPADRPRRRDPLPRGRGRRREDLRPGLRDRRQRPAHLRRDAPAGRPGHQRPRGADRDRARPDTRAVGALDRVRHRRRHDHRVQPHPLDEHRGAADRLLDPGHRARASRSPTSRRCASPWRSPRLSRRGAAAPGAS